MVRAGLKQDFAAAKKLNDPLIEAYNLLFAENNPAGVKAFLAEKGIIENNLRLPLVPLSKELEQQIKPYLTTLH
jgi:4-hydroxy-tetrahydrodipicolinate synthase